MFSLVMNPEGIYGRNLKAAKTLVVLIQYSEMPSLMLSLIDQKTKPMQHEVMGLEMLLAKHGKIYTAHKLYNNLDAILYDIYQRRIRITTLMSIRPEIKIAIVPQIDPYQMHCDELDAQYTKHAKAVAYALCDADGKATMDAKDAADAKAAVNSKNDANAKDAYDAISVFQINKEIVELYAEITMLSKILKDIMKALQDAEDDYYDNSPLASAATRARAKLDKADITNTELEDAKFGAAVIADAKRVADRDAHNGIINTKLADAKIEADKLIAVSRATDKLFNANLVVTKLIGAMSSGSKFVYDELAKAKLAAELAAELARREFDIAELDASGAITNELVDAAFDVGLLAYKLNAANLSSVEVTAVELAATEQEFKLISRRLRTRMHTLGVSEKQYERLCIRSNLMHELMYKVQPKQPIN
jgi:hypothetical protein